MTVIHREEVKAAIRMKFGSVLAFANASGLKGEQVRDTLRGKSSRAMSAIASLLDIDVDHLTITGDSLFRETDSSPANATEHLKREVN